MNPSLQKHQDPKLISKDVVLILLCDQNLHCNRQNKSMNQPKRSLSV